MSNLFCIKGSVSNQLQAFDSLRRSDPQSAKLIFECGMRMVTFAENGQLRKFQTELSCLERNSDLLTYFVPQMIKGALTNGHLMLVSFIIDNGYPLLQSMTGLPNSVHEVFNEVDDIRANHILEFLMNKGLNVNIQVRSITNHIVRQICFILIIGQCYF